MVGVRGQFGSFDINEDTLIAGFKAREEALTTNKSSKTTEEEREANATTPEAKVLEKNKEDKPQTQEQIEAQIKKDDKKLDNEKLQAELLEENSPEAKAKREEQQLRFTNMFREFDKNIDNVNKSFESISSKLTDDKDIKLISETQKAFNEDVHKRLETLADKQFSDEYQNAKTDQEREEARKRLLERKNYTPEQEKLFNDGLNEINTDAKKIDAVLKEVDASIKGGQLTEHDRKKIQDLNDSIEKGSLKLNGERVRAFEEDKSKGEMTFTLKDGSEVKINIKDIKDSELANNSITYKGESSAAENKRSQARTSEASTEQSLVNQKDGYTKG